jgi:precorrin-4 C11-methyltransferase
MSETNLGGKGGDKSMESRSPSILIFGAQGLALARRITACFEGQARILAPATMVELPPDPTIERLDVPVAHRLGMLLREEAPLVVISSLEPLVRLLMRECQSTQATAPLIAVDETGRFVMPVLSDGGGHANALAERVATHIGAAAVIPSDHRADETQLLVVGVGAESGVPAEDLDAAVSDVLQAHGLALSGVMTVATLDRRGAEQGFRTWLEQRQWPLMTYTAEELAQVRQIPTPSAVVARAVGTPGVCEPAALLASGSHTLIVPKQKHGRVTVAVARRSAISDAPSHRSSHTQEPSPLTGEGQGGGDQQLASLVASPPCSILPCHEGGGGGRLTIIGIGPGTADLLTVRAINALKGVDVVVGYQRYVRLLGDYVAGKEVRGSAIGRESERAGLAIELARQGRRVALISSGDAGIYGMAGLALEELERQGWPSDQMPAVEVIPGVTAAQAVASLLGAPLANDFAVLSLSDLLKPREVVEQRLTAIAAADVAIALYNPQSQQRRELFQRACQILLRHRPSTTPVAVVRAAYREGQAIHLDELGRLAELPVDMETLVLVGNSQTRRTANSLVTARGYDPTRAPELTARPSAEATSQEVDAASSASVLFVGAGPGDPELLTLRGARALAEADVVVYAGSLVPRGVLAHVKPGARIHNSATLTLEETHRLLTDAYRAGRRVVRLHSGDPSLYGAITEQMALLDEEHIPYQIVPGVSAFQAVAARLGMEYTQPGVVQTIILTRAGGRTGLPANESLAELARHGVTLCIFLSARHVAEVRETLLASYPPTTPVAVAYRATWPDEEITLGALTDLVEMVQRPGYDRTTLIIVGPSLQRHGKRSHLYDPSYQHLFRPGNRRGRAEGGQPSPTGASGERAEAPPEGEGGESP